MSEIGKKGGKIEKKGVVGRVREETGTRKDWENK